ncbi:MAG: aminotransferase class III-fold pyridoxal phosphate-dependent enzyme, partial [Betaproteobacteria bacterium]
LLTRADPAPGGIAAYFAAGVHSLKGEPHVIDVRNFGLVGGIELQAIAGEPTKRAFSVFLDCWEQGLMIRTTGDTIALSPPLIIERTHVDRIVETIRAALRRAA